MRARFAFLVLFLTIVVPLPALATDVSVTATVEGTTPPTPADTAVVFRGIAYPSSIVSIQRSGVTQVTVPADPAARFDVSLGQQTPGTFTYTVFATDQEGRVGKPMNFTLNLAQGSTITLTGIFLGPTIEADKQTLKIGETITLLGQTVPDGAVTVVVSSSVTQSFTTDADGDGLWSRQLLAADVGVGDHTAKAKAVAPTSEVSDFSDPVAFSITPAPDKCSGKNRADINCDGKVNLTDFSILLFFWRLENPANKRADMNGDRVVNLTDLSILLFNWGK